jgi:hypothetical protein
MSRVRNEGLEVAGRVLSGGEGRVRDRLLDVPTELAADALGGSLLFLLRGGATVRDLSETSVPKTSKPPSSGDAGRRFDAATESFNQGVSVRSRHGSPPFRALTASRPAQRGRMVAYRWRPVAMLRRWPATL